MAIVVRPNATSCNCYVIIDREIVVREDNNKMNMKDIDNLSKVCGERDLFEEKDSNICVLGIESKDNLPSGYKTMLIRQKYFESDETEVIELSRAKAILEWRRNTKYCGCCGTKLGQHPALTAMQCPECNNLIFPRIEPCIIVLINKGDKILLAKHAQRNQDIYACIAGFFEAGETAEHAVEREIMEETGLKVKNIRYYGSQSWPFPSQLMLGFTAEYESGEISLQKDEISDAQWFDRNNCPASPQPGSIAYRLIHQC